MNPIIVTNNPQVRQKYNEKYIVKFIEGSYLDVLHTVRNKIHEGHELLTHPLSGSIKPNETPYKSVMISSEKNELHMDSVALIEDCIGTAKKFIHMKMPPRWPQEILADFAEVDCSLMDSAVESMGQFR